MSSQECKKCQITKKIEDFRKNRKVCKDCDKEAAKQRYKDMKIRLNREYYQKHKEKILEKSKNKRDEQTANRKIDTTVDVLQCNTCNQYNNKEDFPRAKSFTGYSYKCYDYKRTQKTITEAQSPIMFQNYQQYVEKTITVKRYPDSPLCRYRR